MNDLQFGQLMICLVIWFALSLIVCVPIIIRIIDKTNREYLAILIFPIWLILSALAFLIYLT